jgi:hypothetical protein
MAKTTCWRLRLKGRLSADQVGAGLPEGANILRVDQGADETYVYYAMAEQPGARKSRAKIGGASAKKVSLDAVTRIE